MPKSKAKIQEFFNQRAATWDERNNMAENGANKIISKFPELFKNKSVIDIGCGTGVLTKALLYIGANHITGIDISGEMIKIANNKFYGNKKIEFICEDITEFSKKTKFDTAIIYNVYPHLEKNKLLVQKIYKLLEKNGKCLIAHGAGRKEINSHHQAHAINVSDQLKSANEESKLWEPEFHIEDIHDEDNLYYILMSKISC